MASFDENGKYIKTNWKNGDRITADKLNKIEESIEAVNDNDISRHVETDARLDALSGELESVNSQLEQIIIDPKNFGAKGDGITDDTEAIKRSISMLKNGGFFTLSDGEYIITEIDFSSKSNCIFNFYGTFKIKSGIDTPYGAIKFGGKNNVINGLNIDGNSEGVNQTQAYGVTANITIKNGAKNLTFNNLTSNNSIFCSMICDGNTNNLRFINCKFENIGEHVLYWSGGNNDGLYFENVYVNNININAYNAAQSHEGYFIKSAGGNNKNVYIKNLIQKQERDAIVNAVVFLHSGVDNVVFENIELYNKVHFSILGGNCKKIKVINLKNEKGMIIYNYSPNTNDVDFEIHDSVVNSTQYHFNLIKFFKNCKLNIDGNYEGTNNKEHLTKKTSFIDCEINGLGGLIRFPHVHKSIEFINCDIVSNCSKISNYFINLGYTEKTDGTDIMIKNCYIDVSNYACFLYATNKSLNLNLENININCELARGSYNNLIINNLNTNNLTTAISGQTISTNKTIARNIMHNNISFTKKTFQKTISTTSVSLGSLQYSMFKIPLLSNVKITTLSDTCGISLYPVINGNVLTVACKEQPASPIDFSICIDIEE